MLGGRRKAAEFRNRDSVSEFDEYYKDEDVEFRVHKRLELEPDKVLASGSIRPGPRLLTHSAQRESKVMAKPFPAGEFNPPQDYPGEPKGEEFYRSLGSKAQGLN